MRNLVIRTFQKMCTWGVYQRSQIGAWLELSIQLVDIAGSEFMRKSI